jgi:hypothetical protein
MFGFQIWVKNSVRTRPTRPSGHGKGALIGEFEGGFDVIRPPPILKNVSLGALGGLGG